jgi:predicted phage terminase large subunit-like protein
MDRAKQYLAPWTTSKEIRWIDKLKCFIFPSGSRLNFAFLDSENDRYKLQGAEFTFIGIDEASQISEGNFLYTFSRLRKNAGNPIPLRFRCATNPSSDALHLYYRYISTDKPDKTKIFIPAGISDNPHIAEEEYRKTLENLDPITKQQLLHGEWLVKKDGVMFRPEWFKFVDLVPKSCRFIRVWDIASSDPKINKRADYTVGLLIGRYRGYYYVADVLRFQGTPAQVDQIMLATAFKDGRAVPIHMQIDPGSAGRIAFEHYVKLLSGFVVKGQTSSGSKVDRAKAASSACENGQVYLERASWNKDFVDETSIFPSTSKTAHDDQVDAFSWGFNAVAKMVNPNALPDSVVGNGSYWSR